MIKISASKLKTYEQCDKLYFFSYMRGDKSNNIWALLGTAAHKSIELHYREGKSILETFIGSVSDKLTPNIDGFELAQSTMNTIQQGLMQFDPTLYTPRMDNGKLALEKYFSIPYNDEVTIIGYMDIVTDQGVVDFKTGKDKPSKKALGEDLQFILYAYVYKVLYGVEPEYVIHHRIRDNKVTRATTFNYDKLHTMIDTYLNQTLVPDITPCNNCPFYCGINAYVTD